MANYYSSLYRQNPQNTSLYEPIGTGVGDAGVLYVSYFQITVPVGFTTGDVLNLVPIQTAVPTATPQIAGIRFARVVLRSSGNAGGTPTGNFGVTGAATAFGAAITTLQSATTLDVPVATVQAAGPLLATNAVALVAASGTTTTQITVDGYVQFYMQSP